MLNNTMEEARQTGLQLHRAVKFTFEACER